MSLCPRVVCAYHSACRSGEGALTSVSLDVWVVSGIFSIASSEHRYAYHRSCHVLRLYVRMGLSSRRYDMLGVNRLLCALGCSSSDREEKRRYATASAVATASFPDSVMCQLALGICFMSRSITSGLAMGRIPRLTQALGRVVLTQ